MIISAACLPEVNHRLHLETFEHERVLKRRPYKATWRSGNQVHAFSVIPDAFLAIHFDDPDGVGWTASVLLEHDRGTEEKVHFKQRIRGYIGFLKAAAYKELFGVSLVSVGFTTFLGEKRRDQMRAWTLQELSASNESTQLASMFCFAALPYNPSPRQAWLDPVWRPPFEGRMEPMLLGAERDGEGEPGSAA